VRAAGGLEEVAVEGIPWRLMVASDATAGARASLTNKDPWIMPTMHADP